MAAARAQAAASVDTPVATPGNAPIRSAHWTFSIFRCSKVLSFRRPWRSSDTGTINLPLVGEIPASGKTAQEMERRPHLKAWRKYLQNPQVTVIVKEYNSQRVTVSGAIKNPGVFPLKGKTTLLQVVAMAGGFEDEFRFDCARLETKRGQAFGREVRRQ